MKKVLDFYVKIYYNNSNNIKGGSTMSERDYTDLKNKVKQTIDNNPIIAYKTLSQELRLPLSVVRSICLDENVIAAKLALKNKIQKIFDKDPCTSYSDISKELGLSPVEARSFCISMGIPRLKKKEYVIKILKEHPCFSYPIIDDLTGYGKGNIARLAKKLSLERISSSVLSERNAEIMSMFKQTGDVNVKHIVDKYGCKAEEINKIVDTLKANKKGTIKSKVEELLKTTDFCFSYISILAGCDIAYVSRIAKNIEDTTLREKDTCKFLEYAITNGFYKSYYSIINDFPRMDIDTVLSIMPLLPIVNNEKAVIDSYNEGVNILDIAIKYSFDEYCIETLLIKHGVLQRNKNKEKQCICYLKENPKATYCEAAKAFDYFAPFVKIAAKECHINRGISNYRANDKSLIAKYLIENPEWTYKDIAEKVGRSTHTIWKVAKEYHVKHNS